MDHQFCPGSRFLRQPAPEAFFCPNCGEEVEIWTDEFKRECPNCHRSVLRDATMGCLDWCKYAKECVGDVTYDRYMENRAKGLKKKLMDELEEFFGSDRERIEHAQDVLKYAEELLEMEEADWHIVAPASILHDIGIKPSEQKYGSSDAVYQEREGPPIARQILLKMGFVLDDIQEICDIIGHHHHPKDQESLNFKVLYDADCLVNLKNGKPKRDELKSLIETTFLTPSGRKLATRELMEG
jgi:HD superfamily phosphodiesterase